MLIFSGYGLINIDYALIVFILVQTSRVLGENETYELYSHAMECQPWKRAKVCPRKEDPQLYSNDNLSGFQPGREWPEIPCLH